MDQPTEPTTESPAGVLADPERSGCGIPDIPDDRFPAGSLQGLRVALVDIEDDDLRQWLADSAAVICPLDADDLQVLVVDSTRCDGQSLRESLGTARVGQLRAGGLQIISYQHLLELRPESRDQDVPGVRRLHTPAALADLLGVPVSTIRRWHRRGLIQPVSNVSKLPYFDFLEVSAARQLATLVELGMRPGTIEKNLAELARWWPEIDRPLAQLSMAVDGKQILLRRDAGWVEPGGQIRLNFEPATGDSASPQHPAEDEPAILPFSRTTPASGEPVGAEQFIEMAEQQEEDGDFEAAIETWRAMQFACGVSSESCLRLGESLYRTGRVQAACERYYVAVELDEDRVEARAALGCVLHELGQTELAISAFEGALWHHPHYAEVHFHLAQALESAGRPLQALRHWQTFLELTPAGPWAEEARSRVNDLSDLSRGGQASVPDS